MTDQASAHSHQLSGFPDEENARLQVIEAALFASGRPLTLEQLQSMFGEDEAPSRTEIKGLLNELEAGNDRRGIELVKVAGGYRFQTKRGLHPWLSRLWDEKPKKYSRALMETLALIAYRQPITRGEIEDVRGVSVASNIIRTLLEREWVQPQGHRDVPGRPTLFGTTQHFLDYFGLESLNDLPPLNDIKSMAELEPELDLETGLPETDTKSFASMLSRMKEDDEDDGNLDSELREHWESLDELNDQFETGLRRQDHPDESSEPAGEVSSEPSTESAQESSQARKIVTPDDDAGLTEAEKLALIQQKLAEQASMLEQTEQYDEPKDNSQEED